MAARFARSLAAGMCLMAAAPGPEQRPPELAYQLTEGQNLNAFVRDGKVAAHLLLRSGNDPRILIAFPAGNSGVGLWFDRVATPVAWRLEGTPQPVTLTDGRGRPLYGIRAFAIVAAPRLAIKQAVLSNIRFLRDYQAVGKFPAEVAAPMRVEGDRIAYARDRVDGAPGYRLELRVREGRFDRGAITAGARGRIRLEIVGASGDPPLTGLILPELLNDRAADDPAARNALHFLSYREKFLAGSWRFNTYFGRDTLMSVRLLMPALRPAAIEAGLGAVLARLNQAGEVAHEEGLSEFAILDRRQHGGSGDTATLDYAMIDDDFMLAPVAAHYLLDQAQPDAARTFLGRDIPSETRPGTERAGAALVRNLRFVLEQARPFAQTPGVAWLVSVKSGRTAGQWRDSGDGIGDGRYPYDVNAVFVPAALDAAARLFRAGLLDPYLTATDRAAFGRAGGMAELWRGRVPGLFRVSVPAARAAPMIRTYAAGFGVPPQPALAALGKGPLTFHSIALDATGAPVPILNSDEGFALLFGDPSPADLDTFVGAIMRPFPAGLMIDIGLLVANPVLAEPAMQARFTPSAYHGTVVWSWQQALLAAGLERQLARNDLPATTRDRLREAQARLWRAISATRALQSSELWSWAYEGGRYRIVPFGAGRQDVDESNAAQLWSTVYLAVRPPSATRRTGRR